MYRAEPEFNKICVRASRDRAYQKHLEALRKVKPSIDTRQPIVPQTIGRNYKRYEIEKQKNLRIRNQNIKLVQRMDKMKREEHFPAYAPQRPYTLQGRWQKDEFQRITRENNKIVHAVQNMKPVLNHRDWRYLEIDHEYQHHKNAEYKPTLPMSEIIKMDEERRSARRNKHTSRYEEQYYKPQPPAENPSQGQFRPRPPSEPREEQFKPRPPNDDRFSFQDGPAAGLLEEEDEHQPQQPSTDDRFSFQEPPASGLIEDNEEEESKPNDDRFSFQDGPAAGLLDEEEEKGQPEFELPTDHNDEPPKYEVHEPEAPRQPEVDEDSADGGAVNEEEEGDIQNKQEEVNNETENGDHKEEEESKQEEEANIENDHKEEEEKAEKDADLKLGADASLSLKDQIINGLTGNLNKEEEEKPTESSDAKVEVVPEEDNVSQEKEEKDEKEEKVDNGDEQKKHDDANEELEYDYEYEEEGAEPISPTKPNGGGLRDTLVSKGNMMADALLDDDE